MRPKKPGSCRPPPLLAASSLEELVQSFILTWRASLREEDHYYRSQGSLPEAISAAALSFLPTGKRHSHQYRIPGYVLERLRAGIDQDEVRRCRSFDELYALVRSFRGRIKGVGALLVYDVAQRLGVYLGLEPERVYLHQGAREGAKALGVYHGNDCLERRELPTALSPLNCSEVEDFLCICKGALERMRFSGIEYPHQS